MTIAFAAIGAIGIGTCVALFIFATEQIQRWNDWIERRVADPGHRREIADILDRAPNANLRYAAGIGALDAAWSRLFGEKPLSLRVFGTCLSIAFLYPLLLFIFAWICGGAGDIGGVRILRMDIDSAGSRAWRAALVIASFVPFLFSLFYVDEIQHAAQSALRSIGVTANWLSGLLAYFLVLVAGAGAGAGAVAVAGAGAGAGAVAVAVAVAVAGTFYLTDDVSLTLILGFFFIALPLANAALDTATWAVTRTLVRALIDRMPDAPLRRLGWRMLAAILFRGLFDAALGIGFLFLLAALLPNVAEGYSRLFSGAHIDWRDLADAARDAPFTDGLMVTGMLVTTLIPTMLHVGVALLALLIWPIGPAPAALVRDIRALPEGAATPLALIVRAQSAMKWRLGRWVVAMIFGVVVTGALILALFHFAGGLGALLYATAEWATAWAGDAPRP